MYFLLLIKNLALIMKYILHLESYLIIEINKKNSINHPKININVKILVYFNFQLIHQDKDQNIFIKRLLMPLKKFNLCLNISHL